MGPSSALPSGTRALCSRGDLHVGCVNPSVVVALTTVGPVKGRVAFLSS